jgi:hypothetical protein
LWLASSRIVRSLALIGVAAGEALVQVQLADHVRSVVCVSFLDGHGQVLDLVHRLHRVHHLEVEQRVDLRHHVVLGDHVLLGEVIDRLAQVDALLAHELHVLVAVGQVAREAEDDLPRLVEHRDDDVEAGGERRAVLAEALDHHGFALLDDAHALGDHEDHEDGEQREENGTGGHGPFRG